MYIPWSSLSWKERYIWLRGLLNKEQSHTGKIQYSERSAHKARIKMEEKYPPKKFDVYKCLWCKKFHIGRSVKTSL